MSSLCNSAAKVPVNVLVEMMVMFRMYFLSELRNLGKSVNRFYSYRLVKNHLDVFVIVAAAILWFFYSSRSEEKSIRM